MFFLFWAVNGLGRKLANFFLCQKRLFRDNFGQKRTFSKQEIGFTKKVKKSTFSKGVSRWFLFKKMTSFDLWFF